MKPLAKLLDRFSGATESWTRKDELDLADRFPRAFSPLYPEHVPTVSDTLGYLAALPERHRLTYARAAYDFGVIDIVDPTPDGIDPVSGKFASQVAVEMAKELPAETRANFLLGRLARSQTLGRLLDESDPRAHKVLRDAILLGAEGAAKIDKATMACELTRSLDHRHRAAINSAYETVKSPGFAHPPAKG